MSYRKDPICYIQVRTKDYFVKKQATFLLIDPIYD